MFFFERQVGSRRYRMAGDTSWDSESKRTVTRHVVLGPADRPPTVDLAQARTTGTARIGDIGALAWVAEQLKAVELINEACGDVGPRNGPTVGEMVVAVALQRACDPGPKCDLGQFLSSSLPKVSCASPSKFTGQAFHRMGQRVDAQQLEQAQIALARAAVQKFELSADVLAFDTTNFDTHIATTTPGELAKRGHAKSKRSDLRVVGLGLLVSETGHVPLFHHTYPGNGSDQGVLEACLDGLGRLHDALDDGEGRREAQRTVVRDGGFWSPQLELELEFVGYFSLISLPLSHSASQKALQAASKKRAMRKLTGALSDVRATRLRTQVGDLDRTLVVVESEELLKGQKRGMNAALAKAKAQLKALQARVDKGQLSRQQLEDRVNKALRREHLKHFVVVTIGGDEKQPTLDWRVDPEMKREFERTQLGRRVLCTDRHSWETEKIVAAFRGQWKVEELFRRAKSGGVVPWGPSFQWVDSSLRLHTFAAVLGLMLVSLARVKLQTEQSAKAMLDSLAAIEATLVQFPQTRGRPATYEIAPQVDREQLRAIEIFELARWMPRLSSIKPRQPKKTKKTGQRARNA